LWGGEGKSIPFIRSVFLPNNLGGGFSLEGEEKERTLFGTNKFAWDVKGPVVQF